MNYCCIQCVVSIDISNLDWLLPRTKIEAEGWKNDGAGPALAVTAQSVTWTLGPVFGRSDLLLHYDHLIYNTDMYIQSSNFPSPRKSSRKASAASRIRNQVPLLKRTRNFPGTAYTPGIGGSHKDLWYVMNGRKENCCSSSLSTSR